MRLPTLPLLLPSPFDGVDPDTTRCVATTTPEATTASAHALRPVTSGRAAAKAEARDEQEARGASGEAAAWQKRAVVMVAILSTVFCGTRSRLSKYRPGEC